MERIRTNREKILQDIRGISPCSTTSTTSTPMQPTMGGVMPSPSPVSRTAMSILDEEMEVRGFDDTYSQLSERDTSMTWSPVWFRQYPWHENQNWCRCTFRRARHSIPRTDFRGYGYCFPRTDLALTFGDARVWHPRWSGRVRRAGLRVWRRRRRCCRWRSTWSSCRPSRRR